MILLLVAGMSLKTFAQHEENGHDTKAEHTSGAHDDHAHHKHHLSIFNGATTNFTHHNSTDYTIGLEYEYRFSKLFGAGLLGEYIATESGEIIYGAMLIIHPTKGLKIGLDPLLARVDDHGHTATHFLFRINGTYDFHLGNYTIGPSLSYDIGETKALVYGISLGIGF